PAPELYASEVHPKHCNGHICTGCGICFDCCPEPGAITVCRRTKGKATRARSAKHTPTLAPVKGVTLAAVAATRFTSTELYFTAEETSASFDFSRNCEKSPVSSKEPSPTRPHVNVWSITENLGCFSLSMNIWIDPVRTLRTMRTWCHSLSGSAGDAFKPAIRYRGLPFTMKMPL